MAESRAIRPNIPLLATGLVSAIIAIALPVFVMNWGAPDLVFAFQAMGMILFGIYGIVATLLGLASVIPGVAR